MCGGRGRGRANLSLTPRQYSVKYSVKVYEANCRHASAQVFHAAVANRAEGKAGRVGITHDATVDTSLDHDWRALGGGRQKLHPPGRGGAAGKLRTRKHARCRHKR